MGSPSMLVTVNTWLRHSREDGLPVNFSDARKFSNGLQRVPSPPYIHMSYIAHSYVIQDQLMSRDKYNEEETDEDSMALRFEENLKI